ncbi:MAG TPA: M48 family metalloprotease, partial [Azospirillaceae bacterium]|nr:M48 family metalloprotease [Azospirillaceae bacterium]
ISQLCRWTALFGLVMCLALLLMAGAVEVSWWTVAVLGIASPVVAILELAFWRNREFAADLGAVRLTGDPMGLVSALERIDRLERRGWPWLLGRTSPLPPMLLRTHPPTHERVERLLAHVRLAPPTRADIGNLELLTGLMPIVWGPR